jgi:hypothetical protein
MEGTMSSRHIVGEGNYGGVFETCFENKKCVVKAIRQYRDRCSKDDESEIAEADEEERFDVATEVALMTEGNTVNLPWEWLPKVHAVVSVGDLTRSRVKQFDFKRSVGFVPVALIYMEKLQETFQCFIDRHADGTEVVETLRLFSDLLYVTVLLGRYGIRHNDLMLRNVMLRRVSTPPPRRRLVLGNMSFEWSRHSSYEIVVIDWGLASVSEDSKLHAPDIVTHLQRDEMYGKNKNKKEPYKVHPLETSMYHPARNLIDLHCIAHCVRSVAATTTNKRKRITYHPTLIKWCLAYAAELNRVRRKAQVSGVSPHLDEVVAKLMPMMCCKARIVI